MKKQKKRGSPVFRKQKPRASWQIYKQNNFLKQEGRRLSWLGMTERRIRGGEGETEKPCHVPKGGHISTFLKRRGRGEGRDRSVFPHSDILKKKGEDTLSFREGKKKQFLNTGGGKRKPWRERAVSATCSKTNGGQGRPGRVG